MKRTAILALVLLAAVSSSFAQMGPGQPGMPGMPGMPGTPRFGAGMPNMPGPGLMIGPMMGTTVVAPDGTAFVVRRRQATDGTVTADLVAVRPTSAIAWTAPLDVKTHRIELFGSLVVAATAPGPRTGNGQPPVIESELVALSAATGAQQWTLRVDGMIGDLAVAPNGLYATVFAPVQRTRSLVLINASGQIVWTLPID